jgi:hypothetical protein
MASRIDFGELVECVRQGADGSLVLGAIGLGQHSLDVPLVLEAVRADYQKVAALGRLPMLSVMDLDELRTAAGEVYHQDVIEHEIAGPDPAAIVGRLAWVQDHVLWHAGMAVVPPGVVLHDGNLYRCLQAHTTQSDWSPDATPALWARYYAPGETPVWVQPTGSHDAWPLGAHVMHDGQEWISDLPANVWEPGVLGWSLVDGGGAPGEWQPGVAYAIGDEVAYQGVSYRCRQAHTSQVGWEPPAVLALWLPL